MRALARWLSPVALLVALAAGALEAQRLSAQAQARVELTRVLSQTPAPIAELQSSRGHLAHEAVRSGHDELARSHLSALADAQPSAFLYRLLSLAEVWSGGRERDAARTAAQAARLSPGDPTLAALAERTLDQATWAKVRGLSRPLGATALLVLAWAALRGWMRHLHLRRRRRFTEHVQVAVSGGVDGHPTPVGSPLVVGREAHHVHLDVFFAGSRPAARPSQSGPTLTVALSSAEESRTVRLTPVKDVRQDALRVRFTPETLALLRARPGRWRATLGLDGQPVAEALIQVA